jgi:hypothetical protein
MDAAPGAPPRRFASNAVRPALTRILPTDTAYLMESPSALLPPFAEDFRFISPFFQDFATTGE